MNKTIDSIPQIWIKRSDQTREYEFWNYVFQKKWDQQLLERGILVPSSLLVVSKKPFCFQMQMAHGGQPLLECFSSMKPSQYKQCLRSFWKICETLEQFRIVHGDIHLKNILVLKKKLSLIDFGISSISKKQNPLHEIYLWGREDIYRFLQFLWQWKVLGLKWEQKPKTDFRKDRKTWIRYFKEDPQRWEMFKVQFQQWFLDKKKSKYQKLMDEFLSNLLSSNGYLIQNDSVDDHSVVKLLLERFSFLFQVEFNFSIHIKDHHLAKCIHQFIHQTIMFSKQ